MTFHPLERRQKDVPTMAKGVGRRVYDKACQSDRLASAMPPAVAQIERAYNVKQCERAYRRLVKALGKSIIATGTSRGRSFSGIFVVRDAKRFRLLHGGEVDPRVTYTACVVGLRPRHPARVCISGAYPASVHLHAVQRYAQREMIDDVDAIIAELDRMTIMAAAMLPSRISDDNPVAEPSFAVPSLQGGVWVGYARVNQGSEGAEPTFDVRTYLDADMLNDTQLAARAGLTVADAPVTALVYARTIQLSKWRGNQFHEPEPHFDTSLCELFDPVSGDNAARRAGRNVHNPFRPSTFKWRVALDTPLPAEFLDAWEGAAQDRYPKL